MTHNPSLDTASGNAASQLTLDPITLGGNRFGSALDVDSSYALLDRHLELGGSMIDTALVYADWLPDIERACSEKLLGRWLASRGVADTVIIATKGGHPDLGLDPADRIPRLDPSSLRLDVSRSLDHLGLSSLALWWLHRDDPRLPVTEILDAVEALRSEGLIAQWGVANWSAPRIADLRAAARVSGVPGPAANSAGFALAPPAPGALAADLTTLNLDLHHFHERTQLPLLAYSAQAKGWLERAVRGEPSPHDALYDHGSTRVLASVLSDIGTELEASATEVALVALSLLPYPVSAVVGPGNLNQLESCWRAARLPLTPTHREVLTSWVSAAIRAGGDQPLTEPEVKPATK